MISRLMGINRIRCKKCNWKMHPWAVIRYDEEKKDYYCPDCGEMLEITEVKTIGGNTCGGQLVEIRGRYPKDPKRKVCPTCLQERLEQINDISSSGYGVACQDAKRPIIVSDPDKPGKNEL